MNCQGFKFFFARENSVSPSANRMRSFPLRGFYHELETMWCKETDRVPQHCLMSTRRSDSIVFGMELMKPGGGWSSTAQSHEIACT